MDPVKMRIRKELNGLQKIATEYTNFKTEILRTKSFIALSPLTRKQLGDFDETLYGFVKNLQVLSKIASSSNY
ncbi:hypothetical protein [Lactobacillus helveticus]|uniref:hypothetical protein n=1 Tax=Lactobacillus helveticus TaxID=1587 RepID=UPI0015638A90|nr:hypothetical protein [Lactobacillus helveticus]NRO45806.1 hypothetical protein [Lactobacillus helveticus]